MKNPGQSHMGPPFFSPSIIIIDPKNVVQMHPRQVTSHLQGQQ